MTSDPLAEMRKATAILIGSSKFPRDPQNLSDLPSVVANVIDLERVLLDGRYIGLKKSAVHRILDERHTDTVYERVEDLSRSANDALLLYYAGHGLVDDHGGLLLTVVDSTFSNRSSNTMQWSKLRDYVEWSPARHKIVILDCCYSGLATMGEADLNDQLATTGSVVIASGPGDHPSYAPSNARLTTFTGVLLEVVEHGMQIGRSTISVRELFRECRKRMLQINAREPQIKERGDITPVPVFHNVYATGDPTTWVQAARALSVLGRSQSDADRQLDDIASEIRALVLRHRRSEPLAIVRLYELLMQDNSSTPVESLDELESLLDELKERRLLPGIEVTAREIYVTEHHLRWRARMAVAEKRAAAAVAVDWIKDGDRVFLDAGSSALAVCHNISTGLRRGRWKSLTVATNSVPAAAMLSGLAIDRGYTDSDSPLVVHLAGGRVRMSSSCIVARTTESPVAEVAKYTDGFDIAFVGTNGISWPDGCTTASPLEAAGKRAALEPARTRVVLAESAKYDIRDDSVFATFDMGLRIVTANDAGRAAVDRLQSFLTATNSEIVVLE